MKNFKRMIGTAIAVGLAMVVFGCGGSGFLSESPTEVTGEETGTFHITFGAESEAGIMGSSGVSKDAGGIGYIDMGPGDIQSPGGEYYAIVPEIYLDAATSPDSYEINLNGTCANASACIRCVSAYEDESTTMDSLNIVCTGVLPEMAEGNTFGGYVKFNHYVRTLQEDGTLAAIRINALNPGWSELEAEMMSQVSEADQFYLEAETYGAGPLDKYDRMGCDGDAGTHDTMLIDATVGLPNDPFAGGIDDAGTGTAYTKGISINSDMGEALPFDGDWGSAVNAYRCQFQTKKRFDITVVFDADLDRERVKECGLFVNDYTLPSENYCSAASMDASAVVFADAEGTLITEDATGIAIGLGMLTEFNAENIDPSTVIPANHLIAVTNEPLPAGLDSAVISTSNYALHNLDWDINEITGDDWWYQLDNGFSYAGMDIEDSWRNVKDTNGATFDNAIVIHYTAGMSLSQDWNVSSIEDAAELHNIDVAGVAVVPNAENSSTMADWADARNYLTADVDNSQLDYDNADAAETVRFFNVVESAPKEETFRVEVALPVANIRGIDELAAAAPLRDQVVVMIVDDVSGTGYVMGLQALDISGATTRCCVVYQWDAAGQEYDNGGYLDCSDAALLGADNVVFRLDWRSDGTPTVAGSIDIGDGNGFVESKALTAHPLLAGGGVSGIDYVAFPNNIIVAAEFTSATGAIVEDGVSFDYLRLFDLADTEGMDLFQDLRCQELDDFLPQRPPS